MQDSPKLTARQQQILQLVQRAIARTLSDMDAEIGQLEAQLAKYRRVKEGMMQELLTGKKRLV